jgi:NitT/TauT family transport system substrate-binding protein
MEAFLQPQRDPMKIVLAENFRAVFYAPFYAAYALGEFKKMGVEIGFVESPSPGSAIAAMYAGEVDVVWGGPLRAIKLRDENAPPEKALLAFCEVVGKDPFFVVARKPSKAFDFSDLLEGKFGVVSEVPTPWLCLQEDIRDAGVNLNQINVVADKSMADNLAALGAGEISAAQFFEPYVSMAETQGSGTVVYAAASRGLTAYTTFLSTEQSIEKNREGFTCMTTAIEGIREWMNSAPPAEIVKVIEKFYPHVNTDVMGKSMARYQRLGLWTCERTVSEIGFNRLRQSMLHGGFITSEPAYESCVITL